MIEDQKSGLTLVETNDGSTTIFHPGIGEHYHSHHGALQEAKHVFLTSGLKFFLENLDSKKHTISTENNLPNSVSILEVGFGTGLNYLLTADYCYKNQINLQYTGLERYPLSYELIKKTGYANFIEKDLASTFYANYAQLLERSSFLDSKKRSINNQEIKGLEILPNSHLEIAVGDALEFKTDKKYDILYFDAFSEIHQQEMWTKELLTHLCDFLKPGSVFITYAITGNLKRNMKSLGFQIEKVPGAPGKREMLRATLPR